MTATAIWTNPQRMIAGTTVTADQMNTYFRDNFAWLKERVFNAWSVSAVTTTSTTFVQMTSSSGSLTTTGGYILFWASGSVYNSAANATITIDLAVDSVQQGHATYGTTIVQNFLGNYADNLNLMMITGGGVGGSTLAAGAHTCSIYWKVGSGTATAYLQLFAMEIC